MKTVLYLRTIKYSFNQNQVKQWRTKTTTRKWKACIANA